MVAAAAKSQFCHSHSSSEVTLNDMGKSDLCKLPTKNNKPYMIRVYIWGIWCQKHVSQAGKNNCTPQYSAWVSMHEIPASGAKVLISWAVDYCILLVVNKHDHKSEQYNNRNPQHDIFDGNSTLRSTVCSGPQGKHRSPILLVLCECNPSWLVMQKSYSWRNAIIWDPQSLCHNDTYVTIEYTQSIVSRFLLGLWWMADGSRGFYHDKNTYIFIL